MEIVFGVFLPGITVVPVAFFMFFYGVGIGLVKETRDLIAGTVSSPADISWILEKFVWAILYSLVGVVPLLAIVSLGLTICFGPDQINARPKLRWFVLITGLIGLLLAVPVIGIVGRRYIEATMELGRTIFGYPPTLKGILSFWLERGGIIPLVLVGPVAIGFRYLPLLLRGKRAT